MLTPGARPSVEMISASKGAIRFSESRTCLDFSTVLTATSSLLWAISFLVFSSSVLGFEIWRESWSNSERMRR